LLIGAVEALYLPLACRKSSVLMYCEMNVLWLKKARDADITEPVTRFCYLSKRYAIVFTMAQLVPIGQRCSKTDDAELAGVRLCGSHVFRGRRQCSRRRVAHHELRRVLKLTDVIPNNIHSVVFRASRREPRCR
jgi:hypothetical protein